MMPLLQSEGYIYIYSKYETQTVEKKHALLIITEEKDGLR